MTKHDGGRLLLKAQPKPRSRSRKQPIRPADIRSVHTHTETGSSSGDRGTWPSQSKRKLRAVGLEAGDVDHRPSSKRKDTVLKQGVGEGTELEPGSSVPLVVAAPLPQVPSVVGKSKASAVRKIKSAGFRAKRRHR